MVQVCEFLPSLVLISSFLLSLFLDIIDSSKMMVVLDLAELQVQKSAVDALCLGVELEKECEICLLHMNYKSRLEIPCHC